MLRRGALLLTTALTLPVAAGAQTATVPLPGPRAPAPITAPVQPMPAVPGMPAGPAARVDINPYDRDIDLTVPLLYRDRSIGDIAIRLTKQDELLLDRSAFLDLVSRLLDPKATTALRDRLGSDGLFSVDLLNGTGISLRYDPAALAVVVLQIDSTELSLERLYQAASPDREAPTAQPAGFSAYVNINVSQDYYWEQRRAPLPFVNLSGAIRWLNVVAEGEGYLRDTSPLLGGENTGGGYRFDRTFARLVFDEPEKSRRWMLGDLTPETRGQQGFARIGGIGVIRQRQRFDVTRNYALQTGRQILLDTPSTLRILRNGVLFEERRVEPGRYDLSSLPLLTGSNDVEVQIRDAAGRTQSLNFNSYLDPIDLEPGDFEYAAYAGPTTRIFGASPVYNGPVAFSGFFRKAFHNRPAIGIGLQASRALQNVSGQTGFVLGNGSRLQFDGAVSNTRRVGVGYAAGVSFNQIIDRGGMTDSFSLRADHLSPGYRTLGSEDFENFNTVSVSANYNRSITTRVLVSLVGTYIKTRGNRGDSYRIGATTSYRFSDRWSVRGGIDYVRFPQASRVNGIGFNIALVYRPGVRDRVEARYDRSLDQAELSYQHIGDGEIGSVGFGGVATRAPDRLAVNGYADYIANRFDASFSQSSFGSGFSRLGEQNVSTLRVGTSLAFADGSFGVGRTISDSFALLTPHKTLKGRTIVAGQSIADNSFTSKSGLLGSAVNGYLSSYTPQSVQYDVADVPLGYDIGPGVYRVKPPYRSGYRLVVGTDAFVTVMGTLNMTDGKPLALATGTLIDASDDAAANAAKAITFFTNSVGRFAVSGLAPGRRYRLDLANGAGRMEIAVPRESDGLYDMKTVTVAQ